MNFDTPDADAPGELMATRLERKRSSDNVLYTRRRRNDSTNNQSPLVRESLIEPRNNFNGSKRFPNRTFNKFKNRLGIRNSHDLQTSNNYNMNNRNPVRKRQLDPLQGSPDRLNKRRFQYDSNDSLQKAHHQSVQNRITKIRNSTGHVNDDTKDFQITTSNPAALENNDLACGSPDIDAADITVEVINANSQPPEDMLRFKMVLDANIQASIKLLQEKRKTKQVVYPFPVKPHITAISTHERFTYL